MAKQQSYQKYIFKIHSSKIINHDCNLNLSINEARKNEEVISLADSTVLRFIDELNNFDNMKAKETVKEIRKELKQLKKEPNIISNRNKIKELYSKIDALQFKKDYVSIIMDSKNHFDILKNGFFINNIHYSRLVGTTNGVKKSTIVFVNSNLYQELDKRLNNGRKLKNELVPAKFEAYKSLSCSASIPVSSPKEILVVDDLMVHFKDVVTKLNDEKTEEPTIETVEDDIELDASDGFGLCSIQLMEEWSKDLKLTYLSSGMCIRNSFCKGMIFPFDYYEFADKFVKPENQIVKDVWGDTHNIKDVDLILTTSMLKLWDSYDSIDDYLGKCEENHYTFSVTKSCPETLENERNLNYQFLQSYELTDNEIKDIVSPTVNEIKDIMGGDINKMILFLTGSGITEENLNTINQSYIKALMIEPKMMNDNYILNRINHMLNKKINEAKIGTVKVPANFAVVSVDPFALCQHIFGLKLKDDDYGLLKSGEIYSQYWENKDVNQIACFRAPMSCHNNIRLMNVAHNKDIDYWFRYMKTVNILNCHDTVTMAENGMDEDGDQIFTTNFDTIIKNTRRLPAIICVQRKAKKKKISNSCLEKANKNSFGDDIGRITNHVTAMFDVQSMFEKNSAEYKELEYRIKCGQLFQQNAIDKTKGIVAKPMPKYWYNRKAIYSKFSDDIQKRDFMLSIVADKKPYFMNYVYSSQRDSYNKYIQNSDHKCMMLFRKHLSDILNSKNNTEEENNFINWYYKRFPVSNNNCTMNRLCRFVENQCDKYIFELKTNSKFDYRIMKSNVNYSKESYKNIEKIYNDFIANQKEYFCRCKKEHIEKEERNIKYCQMKEQFKIECESVCSNEYELCDILLDMCYQDNRSKQFVWDICGETIIENLLEHNNHKIKYVTKDENGDIDYAGNKFKIVETVMED